MAGSEGEPKVIPSVSGAKQDNTPSLESKPTVENLFSMMHKIMSAVEQTKGEVAQHAALLTAKESHPSSRVSQDQGNTFASSHDSKMSYTDKPYTGYKDKLGSNRPSRVSSHALSDDDRPGIVLSKSGKRSKHRGKKSLENALDFSHISIRSADRTQTPMQALKRYKSVDDIMLTAPVFDPSRGLVSVHFFANNLGEWHESMRSQAVNVGWFDMVHVLVDNMAVQKVSSRHTLTQATKDDLNEYRRFLVGKPSSPWDHQNPVSMGDHPAKRHSHKFCAPGVIHTCITELCRALRVHDATSFTDENWRLVFSNAVKQLMQTIVSSSGLDDAALTFSINKDEHCGAFVSRLRASYEELQDNSSKLDEGSRMTVQVQTVIGKAQRIVINCLSLSHARGLAPASDMRWQQASLRDKRDWDFLSSEAHRIDGLITDARYQVNSLQDSITSLSHSSGLTREILISTVLSPKSTEDKDDQRRPTNVDAREDATCTVHPYGTHTNEE